MRTYNIEVSPDAGLDIPGWVAFAAGIEIGRVHITILLAFVAGIAAGIGIWMLVDWGVSRRETPCVPQEPPVIVQGPWGGSGGQPFYDGRGDVVEITVHYDVHCVTKLQVQYEQSGARFEGAPHGHGGGKSTKIFLDYPDEYLKQVVGTYGPAPVKDLVTSLTFITNKQTYGPYGPLIGQEFQSAPTGVVGFFGRSGNMLDQLGVFTKYSGPPSKLRPTCRACFL